MIRKLWNAILPPKSWRVPVLAIVGIIVGVGSVIFYQSRAHSYLFDDPEACINCHIMIPQYTTWKHSSHARVASFTDCHVHHNNIFNTYYFKAKDGGRHSALFTFRMEEQVIKITEPSIDVVQQNCIRCHEAVNLNVKSICISGQQAKTEGANLCWDCHREVPHGRTNSLSSVPNAKMQLEAANVPQWLHNHLKSFVQGKQGASNNQENLHD